MAQSNVQPTETGDQRESATRRSVETAQDMANHSDPRTTKLYDRP
jgi:hypothetical protein